METLKEHFSNVDNFENRYIKLMYDEWLCKGSTIKEQKTIFLPLSEALEKHPDWIYDGAYTLENSPERKVTEVWATATDDKKYVYPYTLSKEEVVKEVSTLQESDPDVPECYVSDDNAGYFVENDNESYDRIYYFPDSNLYNRVEIDEQIQKFLSKDKFVQFLKENVDPNSLMVLDKMCIVWDDEDKESKVRSDLYEETFDEYSMYACEDNLGLTWVERQVVFVNAREIMNSSINIGEDDFMGIDDVFIEGFAQTVFHECRHLLYECNELVQLGTFYPHNGGLEQEVEDYGNLKASQNIYKFERIFDEKELKSAIEKEKMFLNKLELENNSDDEIELD